jgi:hypothetical protein
MSEASQLARRHVAEWKTCSGEGSAQQRLLLELFHEEFIAARDERDLFDRAAFVEDYMATSESLYPSVSGHSWSEREAWDEPCTHECVGTLQACPLCGCRRLHATQAGFSLTKAALGDAAFGVLGLAARAIDACKVTMTCLACGNTWRPRSH